MGSALLGVSGTVALVLGVYPQLTPDAMQQHLINTADPVLPYPVVNSLRAVTTVP